MSSRRRKPQNRGRQPQVGGRLDLWRPVPELPPTKPIVPSTEPAAMLRSLGDPPLQGQGAVAEHYLAAVIERASGLATALAATADLLGQPSSD